MQINEEKEGKLWTNKGQLVGYELSGVMDGL